MRNIVFLSLMFALLWGPGAYGLTMDEAVSKTLEHNHRIRQFGYLTDSAGQRVGTARAGFLPGFNLSYSYTEREKAVTFAGKRTERYGAQASYNLFNGFSDVKGFKQAKAGARAASYSERAILADVVLAVKSAYIDALKARRAVQTSTEAVELLEKQRRDSELYYREGLIAKNDLLKVEVELASARQDLLEANGSARIALSLIERLMAVPMSEGETLMDFEGEPEPQAYTLDALREEMLGRRSEIKYLTALRNSYRYGSDAIRGGYLPRVDLALDYSKSEDSGMIAGTDLSTEETKAVLSATWNIFDGLSRHYRMSEIKYLAMSTEEQIKDTEEELVFQLRQALEDYSIAVGKLEVAGAAVKQAEENYRVTENRFRERVSTTTDLLDARTFLTRARNQYNTALYDVHLAVSRIDRVLEKDAGKYGREGA